MKIQGKDSEIISLFGPLRAIYLPSEMALRGPAELGRALAAWDYNLSHHEIELLELLARGLTNEEIAELLGAAELNTIKKKLKTVFNKLEVRNRTQAVGFVAKYGFDRQIGPAQGPLG